MNKSLQNSEQNARKCLYIHIGAMKTGTTSIQRFLIDQTEFLEEKNIRFVRAGLQHCIHRYYKDNLDSIVSEILNTSFRSYIISEELISINLDSEILPLIVKKVAMQCDVKLIFYVRRQDLFFESQCNEAIKGGGVTLRTKQYFETCKSSGDYLATIDFYKKALGIKYEDFIVRVFDKMELLQGDVVIDFLSVIFPPDLQAILRQPAPLAALGLKTPPQRNISKDLDYIEYKRILNSFYNHPRFGRHLKTKEDNEDGVAGIFFLRSFNNFPPERTGEKRSFLSLEESNEILDYYKEGNSLIAKKYFDRDTLFDEESKISTTPYSGISLEKAIEVTCFFLLAIADTAYAQGRHQDGIWNLVKRRGRLPVKLFFSVVAKVKKIANVTTKTNR